jgi:thioredoxin-related protein
MWFVNPYPNVPRSTHQLASSLLSNKLSYPTTVYLDENFNLLTQVPGYLQPAQLEPIMKYFGDNVYPNKKWEEYSQTFKGEISEPPPAVTPPSPH